MGCLLQGEVPLQGPTVGLCPGPYDGYGEPLRLLLWLNVASYTTRRNLRVALPRISGGYVTKYAPHKALKLVT